MRTPDFFERQARKSRKQELEEHIATLTEYEVAEFARDIMHMVSENLTDDELRNEAWHIKTELDAWLDNYDPTPE